MCHGDYHSYEYFDSKYVTIQKVLLEDDWFWNSLQYDQREIGCLKNRLAIDVKFGMAYIDRDLMKKEPQPNFANDASVEENREKV